jgi:uncharacterized membrane protein
MNFTGFAVSVMGFLLWVIYSRVGSVRDEIRYLQQKVQDLEAQSSSENGPIPNKAKKPAAALHQDRPTKLEKTPPDTVEKPLISAQETLVNKQPNTPRILVPKAPKTDWAQKAQSTFEQNIATKIPVWIGAISLIFAAFFLVKHSIELGWLGPVVRVSFGGAFGAILLVVGQWIGKRENIANSAVIAQGLIGAGLVTLYVSVYAAINLYGLLPPLLGFCCMSVITALAVILSLRHGQAIAVFGLVGGLLTPALIGSDAPNALVMFGYLFLLFSGMFMMLVRKGWWMLAIATLIGVFCWSAFWFSEVFVASDAAVLVVFAMAVSAVVLVVTGKRIAQGLVNDDEKAPIHRLNFTAMAGSILTITWLSFEITLTLFDWSMLGLLSLALMSLAYFQPNTYQKPLFAKLGLSAILFCIWAQDASLMSALAVLIGMCAIYIGGSAVLMRQVRDPRLWAVLQVVAALALFLTSYLVLDVPTAFIEKFGLFWGLISLALAGLAIYQAADIRKKYNTDTVIRDHLVATYALAASAFIAIGLAIEMPWAYLPLAFAGQILATAWVYQKTQIHILKKIMLILACVFIGLNYEQISLFLGLFLSSLMDETLLEQSLPTYMLTVPVLELTASAALLLTALWLTMKGKGDDKDSDNKLTHTLFGTALTLLLAAGYYLLRELFHPEPVSVFVISADFIERGIITLCCAGLALSLLHIAKRFDLALLKPWGYGLVYIAILRFVYFDFLMHNPCWSNSQFVGDTPLINGVTLTYGACTLLAAWAAYNKDLWPKGVAYKALALASLFAFVTFSVRQYFHGGFLMQGSISSAELYSYSVAWLVTGLALLTLGIKRQNKTARMVSLAFILLAVLKVFLFDAGELEGLYRVFSFLGLGVSLIGLSYFYTKFVFSKEQ